jgi:hypothetical protein
MKDQGFPSNEKRNCCSNASRSLPTDKSNMAAGFPKLNMGSKEMPLLVTSALPDTWYIFVGNESVLAESSACRKLISTDNNRMHKSMRIVVIQTGVLGLNANFAFIFGLFI